MGGELTETALVLGVAQTLQDDLACGGGRDASESLGSVVPLLTDHVAVGIGVVRHHSHRTGLDVDIDPSVLLVPLGVAVRRQQRGLDRGDHSFDRDTFFGFDRSQRCNVDIHLSNPSSFSTSSNSASSSSTLSTPESSVRSTASEGTARPSGMPPASSNSASLGFENST